VPRVPEASVTQCLSDTHTDTMRTAAHLCMRPHLVCPWPDDGSNMYVDGIPVVLNGGAHGPVKKRGSIRLSHGFHFVMVDFFDGGHGALLDITYSGPDTDNKEQAVGCFTPPRGVLNEGVDCWSGCNAKQGPCDWCGAGMCCRYGWDDKSNGCDGKIGVPGRSHVCSAPPPPPVIDSGPMAGVTLKPLNSGNGPEMPKASRGRNDKCAQFANQALTKSKEVQLQMMAKCMSQDCAQSMESVGCKYVTPGPGFCYTNPGQVFCNSNPSSPQCIANFADGGQWTPVANFPWIKTDAGQDPPAGGVQFGDAAYSCVCALGCSYQKSINALRCANGGKFVGPSGDSIFPKGLKQSEGVKGIIADSGKKKQCACICGKGNQWISTDGRAG
jgi:hypothetical protein